MKNNLLLLLAVAALAISCNTQKQNVIEGNIEGLQPGDKIVFLTENIYGDWSPVDSVVVKKAGEFAFNTDITGDYVGIRYNDLTIRPFLEDYSTVTLTGSADQWTDIKFSGGLYDYPQYKEIYVLQDNVKRLNDEAYNLYMKGVENEDEAMISEAHAIWAKINPLSQSLDLKEIAFIKGNPGMTHSAAMMKSKRMRFESFQDMEATFKTFSPNVRNSRSGIKVQDMIDRFNISDVGAAAPDFTLTALDGQTITLSDFRGKYVVLDFWGSWCSPCRQVSPMLLEVYNKLKEKGENVEIIGIACNDPDENWKKAIEEDGLTWIQLNDGHLPKNESIQRTYDIIMFPMNVLVSPDGEILYRVHAASMVSILKGMFEIS